MTIPLKSFGLFLSVRSLLCPTFCDPMDCSTPGFPVHHQLPEFTQIHVHWVGEAIQPSHPLSSPSPPTFNLSQHQGLFKWVSSLYQVAKVLAFWLQQQSFQWIFRTDPFFLESTNFAVGKKNVFLVFPVFLTVLVIKLTWDSWQKKKTI